MKEEKASAMGRGGASGLQVVGAAGAKTPG